MVVQPQTEIAGKNALKQWGSGMRDCKTAGAMALPWKSSH